MAGYVQEGGGQQGLHFGYHPEWLSGANSYFGPADAFNNHQSILDTDDNALMDGFFENPDSASVTNGITEFNWPSMDARMNGADFNGEIDPFGNPVQTIQDSSTSSAENSSSSYHTQAASTRQNLPYTPTVEFDNLQFDQPSNQDDLNAALALMNSKAAPRLTQPFNTSTAASWGSLGNHDPTMLMQDNLKGPMASLGRQSASSYHNQQQPSAQASQQIQNGQLPLQMMDQRWYQQQQMMRHMQNDPRARHMSLQMEPGALTLFQQTQQAQPRTPHSALLPGQLPDRPTLVHFGSDSNFGDYGWRGPSNHVPLEHEKGANLNNVPLAAQAAANGHSHMPPFTPMTPSRNYSRYIFPNGPQTYNHTSTSSSPNTLGGLPTTNMSLTPNHHGHPFNQVARHNVAAENEDDSDEDAEFEETQPRKRRKSQMEAEDDAEYTPGKHHVKVSSAKRGAKASKLPTFDGSDDDDEYQEAPSSIKTSVKRRKSSTNARPSLGSSQSGSPATMASPTNKPTASGKKKVRGSHPRTNLTEDEKRRNHIASEKTRRDLIKVQYDQLDIMVPSLKQGKSGLSRSDILKEIVSYVEAVVDGNKKMEVKLAAFSKTQAGSSTGGYG